MKRTLTLAVTFIVIIGALFGVSLARKPKPPAPTTQAIWKESGVPVETSTVTLGDMDETMQVTGDLESLNSAVISPKVSGRLVSVAIREGDRVSRGQVAAVLDQDDAISTLQMAQADLESAKARLSVARKPARSQERMVAEQRVNSAKANLDRAEADYNRNDRLLKRGAISESAFEVVKAQYLVAQSDYKSAQEQLAMIDEGGRREDVSSAQAAVAQAQASVDTAQRRLSNTYIRSPISGVVSARAADPGQIVSPGQVLANVVDLDSVYLKGDVPEKYLAKVNKGQPVSVQIEAIPGRTFLGSVVEIYPSGSTANRNFSVRISIPQADATVRPGMSASGEILIGRRRGVLLVPKDAVDDQEGTQSVFTVDADRIARRHVITVIRTDRHSAEIAATAGLGVGDTVVTQGRKNLQDGAKVELRNGRRSNDVAH